MCWCALLLSFGPAGALSRFSGGKKRFQGSACSSLNLTHWCKKQWLLELTKKSFRFRSQLERRSDCGHCWSAHLSAPHDMTRAAKGYAVTLFPLPGQRLRLPAATRFRAPSTIFSSLVRFFGSWAQRSSNDEPKQSESGVIGGRGGGSSRGSSA